MNEEVAEKMEEKTINDFCY
jgi:hypothetical protein